MNRLSDHSISRRSLLSFLAVAGSNAVMPKRAFSEEVIAAVTPDEPRIVYAHPGLTNAEFKAMCFEKTRESAELIVSQAYNEAETMYGLRGRPEYSIVYGAEQYRKTGWKEAAGQLPGGWSAGTSGGIIFLQDTGGFSLSISFNLPGNLSFISVGVSGALQVSHKTPYAIIIPGDSQYYKAIYNSTFYCQPYVVYETINGVKKVYKKVAVPTLYSMMSDKKRM